MRYSVSTLYNEKIEDLKTQISAALENGLRKSVTSYLFFRADDIGVPSFSFFRMIELFKTYDTPLCLALVPAWLTRPRWQTISRETHGSKLFCHHQHGWQHLNHQPTGKKQEFGDARTRDALHNDLAKGRQRLTALVGSDYVPLFTPPWNRCSGTTLELLLEMRFAGISRSAGATPAPPPGLPDIPINVDLHTRRERSPAAALENLLSELDTSVASGRSGIMLHHQRMNDNAFILLEQLLQATADFKSLEKVSFNELLR